MERKRLVSDDDGHDYVIPADKQRAWYDFLNSEAAELGELPEWAERLQLSPNCYTFTDWQEDR
jgi:hypothetical protein